MNALSLLVLHDPVVTDVLPGLASRARNFSRSEPSEDLLPYVQQGESAFHEVKDLLHNGAWSVEREENGIAIKSLYSPKYSSYVYLTETVVNASAEALVNEYWWHYGRISTWNSQMSRLEIVERISKTVMIARETAADQASQHISRRDFVSVYSRHEVLDADRMVEDYYMCYISTEFPGAPPEGEYVRGAYHPSGFRFSPNGDGSTKFQFVLNVDLKVHALLKPFIRVFMIPSMVEYATSGVLRPVTHDDLSWLHISLKNRWRFTGMGWLLEPELGNMEVDQEYIMGKTMGHILGCQAYIDAVDKSSYCLSNMQLDAEEVRVIACRTIGQRANHLWHAFRRMRVTASKFGMVLRALKRQRFPSFWKSLFGEYKTSGAKVQGGMYITGGQFCDLIAWSPQEMVVVRVPWDKTWEGFGKTLQKFEDLLPYVQQGESAFHEVKDLLHNGDWSLEREENGIVIKSLYSPKYSSYIYLTERISKTTMIAREIAANEWSRFISTRDFVAVYSRHEVLHTNRMNEDFYMCFISTEFSGAPPQEDYVRAIYHSSGFRFSSSGGGSTKFQYVLNVDVKVNALMKSLSRVSMIPTMLEYATRLRNYATTLKRT
ncbi:unnamed protein product [Darwinula stevensoni]|uniref:START domain-containing protein n=1 Tax=Darwinula stevensoni TaxID=69355 RepID=A0A7R8XKR2_9CRUS|nr:unnamed protein product [Darwinula stevensoni]CAG0893420.1 unnamed protein product [Darwinula stevensoni]